MSAAASLLLIRHGETAWNAERRIQGQLDVPLSRIGIAQAALLGAHLARERVDAIVSSDLARATQTAQAVAQLHALPVSLDARLRERAFGVFEGSVPREIQQRWPQHWDAYQERQADWVIPGGESIAALDRRVLAALDDIAQAWPGGVVVVVTHGGVLDAAYRHATGLASTAPRRHELRNASINRVRAEPRPLRLAVLRWAELGHLAGMHDARDETVT